MTNYRSLHLIIKLVLFFVLLGFGTLGRTDSVGQVQTTKYFTTETVNLLKSRLQLGQVGLQVGDEVSYIIQFTPIANGGGLVGAGGYITDYIPAGVQVIQASFVDAVSLTDIPPPVPALMADGFGGGGAGSYTLNGGWTTTDAATLAGCASAALALTACTGNLAQSSADTGIFFSTDPRTALFTGPGGGRIQQWINGYVINPARGPSLTGPIGGFTAGSKITTHNYWDAAMANAFGTTAASYAGLTAPKAANPNIDNSGDGLAPFNAGSPVAGPDSGYQLDYTGSVGPWQRIYYPGSTIGSNAYVASVAGVGTTNGLPSTQIGGNPAIRAGVLKNVSQPTSTGWNLSASNPLPSSVTAVRWSAGRITVGTLNAVKITLKITSPIPSNGLINASEVFGGDASAETSGRQEGTYAAWSGGGNGNRDNAWTYHVPSVADNNSQLYVLKNIIGWCSAGTLIGARDCTITPPACTSVPSLCPPIAGNIATTVPSGQFIKLRYRILYLNANNNIQTKVQVQDILPFSTLVQSLYAGNVYVFSGTNNISTTSPSVSVNLASAGGALVGAARVEPGTALTLLSTPTAQNTISFATIDSLPGGTGGIVELDVVVGQNATTTCAANTPVSNKTAISTVEVPPPGSASVVTTTCSNNASLEVAKTTSTPTRTPGSTATYSITINNVGTKAASTIVVNDYLPSDGLGAPPGDTTHQFSAGIIAPANNVTATVKDSAGTIVSSPTGTVSGLNPETASPYTGLKRQRITWTFPALTTIPAGGSMTITFNATVGNSILASATPYKNDLLVTYNNQGAGAAANATVSGFNLAPVTVSNNLQITKTIDCVWNLGLTSCDPYNNSGIIPVNGKVRYKLSYSAATAQTNVVLSDTLPTQTAANSISNVQLVSGTVPPSTTLTPAIGAMPAGGTTFSFATIPSMAASASGVVTFDVQTNAASGNTVTNTGKIVSTETPGGSVSVVSVVARSNANLVVTKTVTNPVPAPPGSPASLSINGGGADTATYQITVTNTGTGTADQIKIYDELPFSSATPADITKRFNYVATTGISGLTGVAPTLNLPPTQAPYSGTANQREVLWDFGAQTLAAGASFTITYTAQVGTAIPASGTIYYNNIVASYRTNGNTLFSGVTNTAPVTIPTYLSITKTIDCVYNLAGTVCTPYTNSGYIPVNAKVRYKLQYTNTSSTLTHTNVYLCDQITSTQAAPAFSATPIAAVSSTPAVGAPAQIAGASAEATACGYSGANTFAYPMIASLAPNATGNVFFDLTTNAASAATVVNTGKIVSTQAPNGEQSAVSTLVSDVPILQVTKTTSTPTRLAGEEATYTISVKNVGNGPTTSLAIYDFLPFDGTTNDITHRFDAGTVPTITTNSTYSCVTAALAACSPAFTVGTISTTLPPTDTLFSGNTNQQQILWDFGAFALQPGATATITFKATVGTAMPAATYKNSVMAVFTSPVSASSVLTPNTADVVVTLAGAPLTINKTSPAGDFGSFDFLITNGTITLPVVNVTTSAGNNPKSSAVQSLTKSETTTITETTPGWMITSGSCFDNATPVNTWNVVGQSVTIPTVLAARTYTCNFTNARSVSGNVFNDNGLSVPTVGGVANDGIKNGSEAGISGVKLALTDCGATTYSTAITDDNGNYNLLIGGVTGAVCIQETNSPNYVSTGANFPVLAPAASYNRTTDRISFTIVANTGYSNMNFGDVAPNQFETDGSKSGMPGTTLSYTHIFTAATSGTVRFSSSATASPVIAGWSELLYRDTDCNGLLDGTEATTAPAPLKTTDAITVVAGTKICLINKEYIPSGTPMGATNLAIVKATFNYAAPLVLATDYTRQDLTRVSNNALDLQKLVRNVTTGGTFGINNNASKGQTLEYQITYTNNGTKPIDSLVLNDATPAFTTFVSALSGAFPANLTACQKVTPSSGGSVPCATADVATGTGGIKWTFTGALQPGASGAVTFQVKLN